MEHWATIAYTNNSKEIFIVRFYKCAKSLYYNLKTYKSYFMEISIWKQQRDEDHPQNQI